MAAFENGAETLKKVIADAADQRIQKKILLLLKRWDEQDPDEFLFQLLFKSLDYSPFPRFLKNWQNNIILVISDLCFGSLSR